MKHHVLMACAVFALLGAGCATAPERVPTLAPAQLFDDSAFAAPAQPVDPAQALAVSAKMRRYLDVDISPQIHRLGRQRGLVEALYSQAQLRLEYDDDTTRTAAETFDARAGNCLSLVLMTAALAKELHLPVTYQVLVGKEVWERAGDLTLAIGHVNIVVGKRLVDRMQGVVDDKPLELNFGAASLVRGGRMQAIGEPTILAMFLNNRAAERLSRGQVDDAYAHVRQALLQDPRFGTAYNTLGVVYERKGLPARAEQAFAAALDLDPVSRPALANLAKLLTRQGRPADAAVFQERLARVETEAPFLHFDIGRQAVLSGDYGAGRDHLLRELRRDPDNHQVHFWLAQALAGLGDAAGARKELQLAKTHSTTRRDQAFYAAKLARLQSAPLAN